MSISNTGKLEAVVNGLVCQFDGDRWISSEERLADTLNTALRLCPQHWQENADLRQLGERCLQMADFGGRYSIAWVKE
jgi:hypothetical protein